MGVFSTFSNISGIVSPIVLGAVAEAWGIEATFRVSFGLVARAQISVQKTWP